MSFMDKILPPAFRKSPPATPGIKNRRGTPPPQAAPLRENKVVLKKEKKSGDIGVIADSTDIELEKKTEKKDETVEAKPVKTDKTDSNS